MSEEESGMRIKLPYVERFDTLALPDDFEDQIKESFKKYTRGTSTSSGHTPVVILKEGGRAVTMPYFVVHGTGEELKLEPYKGKVILIVNTATGWEPHWMFVKEILEVEDLR